MTGCKTGTLIPRLTFQFINPSIESIEINSLIEFLLQQRKPLASLCSKGNSLIYGKYILVNAASFRLIL
jgi:hypothetical protein